jgi:hypothetical protein
MLTSLQTAKGFNKNKEDYIKQNKCVYEFAVQNVLINLTSGGSNAESNALNKLARIVCLWRG